MSLLGVCHEHGKNIKLTGTFEDCEELQRCIENAVVHIPKECTVAGVAAMNEN